MHPLHTEVFGVLLKLLLKLKLLLTFKHLKRHMVIEIIKKKLIIKLN